MNASHSQEKYNPQSGNILIIILLAVALIGTLTMVIRGGHQSANIDNETLIIRMTELKRYATEMEQGIAYIMQNGHSESDIRFAHPNANADYGDLSADSDKSDQLFAQDGGGVRYRGPPVDVNDGSAWEFYGHTAMPNAGSDAAELIAVLPNVTQSFCEKINTQIGYTGQPQDTATCVKGANSERFDDGTQFSSSPNTTDESSFSITPAMHACVQCTSDNNYHYVYVLMAR